MPPKEYYNLQTFTPEREARFNLAWALVQYAIRVGDGLCYPKYYDGTSPNAGRHLRAVELCRLTMQLLCRPVHRKRFNKRLRAYRQELAHLEKYAPSDD